MHPLFNALAAAALGALVASPALASADLASSDVVQALRERILAFIACVNQTAKPFRWTYAARPLTI